MMEQQKIFWWNFNLKSSGSDGYHKAFTLDAVELGTHIKRSGKKSFLGSSFSTLLHWQLF